LDNIKIAIYGAGGFAREVAWLIDSLKEKHDVACFIDDTESVQGSELNEIPVMGLAEARKLFPEAKIVGGIGSPKVRELVMNKAEEAGFDFMSVIHPNVEISKWVNLGKGVVICAGSIITTNITLGDHVQINLDCTIGHDVVMDDFVTLAPGVHISGNVHIRKGAYLGTGANVINGSKETLLIIEENSTVGAGACVIKDVQAGDTVAGVPAKSIKRK